MLDRSGADAREGLPEPGPGTRVSVLDKIKYLFRSKRRGSVPDGVVVTRCRSEAAGRIASASRLIQFPIPGSWKATTMDGILPVQRMTDILAMATSPSPGCAGTGRRRGLKLKALDAVGCAAAASQVTVISASGRDKNSMARPSEVWARLLWGVHPTTTSTGSSRAMDAVESPPLFRLHPDYSVLRTFHGTFPELFPVAEKLNYICLFI